MSHETNADGAGIRCPRCRGETGVLETRQSSGAIRRRRACLESACTGRVTTVEMVAPMFRRKATTGGLVAVPSEDNADFAVVPRKLLAAIADMLNEVEL